MSVFSMMTLDLGEDTMKIADTIKDCYELGIRSGAAEIANSELLKARQKARAAVDLVIAQVEGLVHNIALEGVSAMYDALGINEQSLKTAKQIVAIARHGTNLGASVLMKGITILNEYQSTQISLPMDAYGAALGFAASYVDKHYGEFVEKYGPYIDFILLAMTNPEEAVELLGEYVLINANQMYNMLDEQCYSYTGMHIVEIYNLCSKGIKLYNEYKKSKKDKKKKKGEEKSEEPDSPSTPDKEKPEQSTKPDTANIKSTGYSFEIETNPEVALENMYNWLYEQNDALFNGFIVLQFLDAIRSIQDMVKTFTEVDVDTLDDNIETLEDFVVLCEQLGLDDDSTAIDLSLIPSLNLNVIHASMNNLKEQFKEANNLQKIQSAAIGAVAAGSAVNISKTYDIHTIAETKTINLIYYTDPTKPSVSKKVYKAFSKAKDANDNPLFSSSDLIVIQNKINDMHSSETMKGSVSVAGYTIDIVINISEDEKNDKSKSEEEPKCLQVEEDNVTPEFDIMTITEEMVTEKQMEDMEDRKRRSTIKVLHTVYSILKKMIPSLTKLAKLIRNYRINKEWVKSNQKSNLYLMYEAAMKLLGLTKKIDTKTNSLYTVRTLELYEYIKSDMPDIETVNMTTEISYNQAKQINTWLYSFDKTATKIDLSKDIITLFFDYDSITEQLNERNRIKDSYGIDAKNKSKHRNGSFDGINKLVRNGTDILYTDSRLPMNSSQIIEVLTYRKRF